MSSGRARICRAIFRDLVRAPGLDDAIRILHARELSRAEHFGVRWKLLSDLGGLAVAFTVAADEAAITVGRVADRLQAAGLASRSRVHALVRTFSHLGGLTAAPAPTDARIRLLAPCGWLVKFLDDWLDSHVVALARCRPDVVIDPLAARARLHAFLREEPPLARPFAELAWALHAVGGALWLLTLLSGARRCPDRRIVSDLSLKLLSRKTGVSRAHFARLRSLGEGRGLVRRDGGGAHLHLSPTFFARSRAWVARLLAIIGCICHPRLVRDFCTTDPCLPTATLPNIGDDRMNDTPDDHQIHFTRNQAITGRVVEALSDGASRLSASQDGVSPFFITDHSFKKVLAPLLVLLADKPFVLTARATAPRGLMMELSLGSASGARTVAQGHSFSSSWIDAPTEVSLDRWADGSDASLAVGSAFGAERDGQGTVSTLVAAQVTVTPLITVDAAGVRWGRKQPLWPDDRTRRLAAALAKLPPSKGVHDDATPEDLDQLLADVEDIVAGLDPLDQLRANSGRPLWLDALEAAAVAQAGSPGSVAVLRHGAGPAVAGGERPLPIDDFESGRESAWPLRFLACRNPAEMDFLRQTSPEQP